MRSLFVLFILLLQILLEIYLPRVVNRLLNTNLDIFFHVHDGSMEDKFNMYLKQWAVFNIQIDNIKERWGI